MHILTSNEVINPNNPEIMTTVLTIKANIAKMIIKNQHLPIPEDQLSLSQKLLEHETGIVFTNKEVRDIICSYPYCRASIIEYGLMDTEAKSTLVSALSLLVLGCEWPNYGDKINLEEFVKVLNTKTKIIFNKN